MGDLFDDVEKTLWSDYMFVKSTSLDIVLLRYFGFLLLSDSNPKSRSFVC